MKPGRQIFVIVAFLLVLLGHLTPLRDPDTWWHIAIGEDILSRFQLPTVDLFSHTFFEQPVFYPDWLGEIFWAVVHKIAGVPSLIAGIIVVMGGVYWFVDQKARDYKIENTLRPVLIVSLFFCLTRFTVARPQLLGFLFFALILWLYGRRKYIWIPLVQILWMNAHRSALLTPLFAFIALTVSNRDERITQATLLLGVTIASLIHPYAREIIGSSIALFQSKEMQANVAEWEALSPGMLLIMYFPLLLGWIIFLFHSIHKRSLPFEHRAQWGISLVVSLAGIKYHRLLPFAAIAFLPLISAYFSTSKFRIAKYAASAYGLCLAAIMILSWTQPRWATPLRTFPLGVGIDREFPIATADFIAKEIPDQNLFNTLRDGGYLLYRFRGRPKVFIDGRTGILYPLSFVAEAANAVTSKANWDRMAAKYDVKVALLPSLGPDRFDSALSVHPAWPVVLLDDSHLVHLKADQLNRYSNLKSLPGGFFVEPFRSLSNAHKEPNVWKKINDALDFYAAKAPNSFKVTVLRAYAAHLDNDLLHERALLQRAVELNPNYEFARRRLAQLQGS